MLAELPQGTDGTVPSWAVLDDFVTDPNDLSERILEGEGSDLWRNPFLLSHETLFHLLPFRADVPVIIFCHRERKVRKAKARARACFGSFSAHSSLDRTAV